MNDLDLLIEQTELFTRLAQYGDRQTFLQTLGETWHDVACRNGDAPQSECPNSNLPEDKITATSPSPNKPASGQPSAYNPEIINVQNYLNQDLGIQLKPDGNFGRKTMTALLQWARKNNLNFPVQQLLDMAKVKAAGESFGKQLANKPSPALQQTQRV